MQRQLAHLLLFFVVCILAGCTSAAARAASGSGSNPYLIGNWELEEIPEYTVMDGIRRLRPAWLQASTRPGIAAGGGGSRYPRVHLDGVPLQDIQELENIRCADVRQMQFITGPDATTRWGTGYSNGVILITTGQ
jgi:hypothetical protein